MTDDLVKRLADIDPILDTEFDTQLGVQRDPYGATRAIEMALYLLRDQADRIEAVTAERDHWHNGWRQSLVEFDKKCREANRHFARAEAAEGKLDAVTAESDRLRELLAEADRRIAWEGHGLGGDFAERVEDALKGQRP